MAAAISKTVDMAARAEMAATSRNRLLSTPALVIITVFGVLPLLIILVYSFLKAAPYGGVEWRFSTDAYLNFLFQRDIFDDTLQHQSCNRTDEVRYCLFVDILRPSLFPRLTSAILSGVRLVIAPFNSAFYKRWSFIK